MSPSEAPTPQRSDDLPGDDSGGGAPPAEWTPVARPGAPRPGEGRPAIQRDLIAEAQVRGLSLWLFLVAATQLLFGGLALAAQGRGSERVMTLLFGESFAFTGLVPPLLFAALLVAFVGRRNKPAALLGAPFLLCCAIWAWANAKTPTRVGISLLSNGALIAYLGLALWQLGSGARALVFCLAGGELLLAALFAKAGMWPFSLWVAVAAAFVIGTLAHPRVSAVFSAYLYHSAVRQDPRAVPLTRSAPLYAGVLWVVVGVFLVASGG